MLTTLMNFNKPCNTTEKSTHELLSELYEINSDDPATRKLITNGQLNDWLLKSNGNKLSVLDTTPLQIKEWNNHQIETWSKKIRKYARRRTGIDESMRLWPELLAVMSRAIQIQKGYLPRNVQKIAVLRFLSAHAEKSGCMAEIATGEGKTDIIAMFVTALNLLYGINSDIATSSVVLAERDADKLKDFYALFGIKATHNNKSYNISAIYRDNNIVYGAVHSFLFHYMYTYLNPMNGRGSRKHAVLVIDEVDSMTLDNLQTSARIKHDRPMPGLIQWVPLLMWTEMIKLINISGFTKKRLKSDGAARRYIVTQLTERTVKIIPEYELPYSVREKQGVGFSPLINENGSGLIDRIYHEFPQYALEAWCDYEENIDYVIANDTIVPVDSNDTGVVKTGTVWTWLDNFLRIKHGLELKNSGVTQCSLSNVAFFRKFGNQLYGMSGTLGGTVFRERFQHVYPGVHLCNIPRFSQRHFLLYPPVITNHPEKKIEICSLRATEEIERGRAVLIFCDNIREANAYFDFFIHDARVPKLLKQKIDSGCARVRQYTRNDLPDEEKVPSETVISCDIIISTRIGGRGMDLSLSEPLRAAGGLHVIQQSLSLNERVEKQAEGRAARMGDPGSGEYIVDLLSECEKLKMGEPLFWNEMHNVFSSRSNPSFLYDPEHQETKNESDLSLPEDALLLQEEEKLYKKLQNEAYAITDIQQKIRNLSLSVDSEKVIRILKARRNRIESNRLKFVVPREIKKITLADALYEKFLYTIGFRTSINQDVLWMEYFTGIVQSRIEATIARYSPHFDEISEDTIKKLSEDEEDFVYHSYFDANQTDNENNEFINPETINDSFSLNKFAQLFLTDKIKENKLYAHYLFEKAIRIDPDHSIFSYYYDAMILFENNNNEAAIHNLECAKNIFIHYKKQFENIIEQACDFYSKTRIDGLNADVAFCDYMVQHINNLIKSAMNHPNKITFKLGATNADPTEKKPLVPRAWYTAGFFGKYEAAPVISADNYSQPAPSL